MAVLYTQVMDAATRIRESQSFLKLGSDLLDTIRNDESRSGFLSLRSAKEVLVKLKFSSKRR